jgi:hypothetical protein
MRVTYLGLNVVIGDQAHLIKARTGLTTVRLDDNLGHIGADLVPLDIARSFCFVLFVDAVSVSVFVCL